MENLIERKLRQLFSKNATWIMKGPILNQNTENGGKKLATSLILSKKGSPKRLHYKQN